MYTPNLFRFDDREGMIGFMTRYSFGTIITSINNIPVASMLPFVIDDRGGRLFIRSHFSAANSQAADLENNHSLVVFAGPHAYISPAHYDKKESVPTWNYVTVQAYGKINILQSEESRQNLLDQMITSYEAGYLQQWNSLPEKFRAGMMQGIIAFEMQVTALNGQRKLSQNKSDAERQRIIGQLSQSHNSAEQDLAAYMDLFNKTT